MSLYQQPYYLAPNAAGQLELKGGTPLALQKLKIPGPASCDSKVNQNGGGSDYQGQFYAVPVNPRELSIITARYIDQSPMFNPLRKNTVIPTVYNGIVPTGAYLYHNLPTNPVSKFNNEPLSVDDLHCLCQKHGVRLYDEIGGGKIVPRNRATLTQKLRQRMSS